MLETELPQPPITATSASQKGDETMDCGICYAQYLPIGNLPVYIACTPYKFYIIPIHPPIQK